MINAHVNDINIWFYIVYFFIELKMPYPSINSDKA